MEEAESASLINHLLEASKKIQETYTLLQEAPEERFIDDAKDKLLKLITYRFTQLVEDGKYVWNKTPLDDGSKVLLKNGRIYTRGYKCRTTFELSAHSVLRFYERCETIDPVLAHTIKDVGEATKDLKQQMNNSMKELSSNPYRFKLDKQVLHKEWGEGYKKVLGETITLDFEEHYGNNYSIKIVTDEDDRIEIKTHHLLTPKVREIVEECKAIILNKNKERKQYCLKYDKKIDEILTKHGMTECLTAIEI